MINTANLAFIKNHIGMYFTDEDSAVAITNFFYGYLYAYSSHLDNNAQPPRNYNLEFCEFLKVKYHYQSARIWTSFIDTLYEQHKQSGEKFYQFLMDNVIEFITYSN